MQRFIAAGINLPPLSMVHRLVVLFGTVKIGNTLRKYTIDQYVVDGELILKSPLDEAVRIIKDVYELYGLNFGDLCCVWNDLYRTK